MFKVIFNNRYTLLAVVLACYLTALVMEGIVTGRDARVVEIDNSLFELVIPDLERLDEDSVPSPPSPPPEPPSQPPPVIQQVPVEPPPPAPSPVETPPTSSPPPSPVPPPVAPPETP